MSARTIGAAQLGKSVEERVGTALGHRIRVEVLTLLNEGSYTADDLAALIHESRQTIHHHLRVLLDGGSIEIARIEKRRNAELHHYRAVEMPDYREEAVAAMTPEERQQTAGLIVQHGMAEVMAALGAGKLSDDPMVCLAWRWFNLDAQGRQEMAEEQVRWWERAQEIEAEATSRRVSSGEDSISYVVAEFGFERARKAPAPPSAQPDK